ncbi:hypothetical protein Pth03_04440 [Planotetraspora thailandica]|uniref:Uncharacterized protein n=1 Tax=Planotetraspora thailandica TaxID=487172 RepID=A0A8J3XTE2_9ACTN|nr:hypothetical protein [Planotetraspora thailandica]GII52055.1 hypothetical protein Pth03_04440 [Planotetraspora thailandica]
MTVLLTLFTCCTPLWVDGLLTAGAFWLFRPPLRIRTGPCSPAEAGAHAAPGVAPGLALARGVATNPHSAATAVVSVSSRRPALRPAIELPAR